MRAPQQPLVQRSETATAIQTGCDSSLGALGEGHFSHFHSRFLLPSAECESSARHLERPRCAKYPMTRANRLDPEGRVVGWHHDLSLEPVSRSLCNRDQSASAAAAQDPPG